MLKFVNFVTSLTGSKTCCKVFYPENLADWQISIILHLVKSHLPSPLEYVSSVMCYLYIQVKQKSSNNTLEVRYWCDSMCLKQYDNTKYLKIVFVLVD